MPRWVFRASQRSADDGIWQRRFDGGLVVVNGTGYDAVVATEATCRDFSTGRVARQFTLPMFDGRILMPSSEPLTKTADVAPRITRQPPAKIRVVALDGDLSAVQTPGGLELRLAGDGEPMHIFWHGRRLLIGGWPVAITASRSNFAAEHPQTPQIENLGDRVSLTFRGTLAAVGQRVDYVETCVVGPAAAFSLEFRFTARTDLALRMWRQHFALPVAQYTGATVHSDLGTIALPDVPGKGALLPGSRNTEVQAAGQLIKIQSSLPLSVADDRPYGSDKFLLAAYPIRDQVKSGTEWTYKATVTVSGPPTH